MRKDLLERVVGYVSKYHKEKIMHVVYKTKLPITRLVAHAIDQELSKEKPFEDLVYKLPRDEVEEYAYAEEASKILSYMKDVDGLGIDQFILLRYDIGISDVQSLLYGIRECVEKKFLEEFIPKMNPFQKIEYPKDYKFYRLTGTGPVNQKKIKKEINDMKRYERLKRKYEK